MGTAQWRDGNIWTNQANWEEPKLTHFQRFRVWLARKIVGRKFALKVYPTDREMRIERTGDSVVFNKTQ